MVVDNPPSTSTCTCGTDSTRSGTVTLVSGTQIYSVTFTYVTSYYGFDRWYIEDISGSAPAQWGLVATPYSRSDSGFSFKLNGNPSNSHQVLQWKISPL